jgi:hypothetical protein
MKNGRRPHLWFCSIALAAPALCSAGCSRVFGPEQMIVTPVSGRVKYANERIQSGWVEFVPVDSTVGKICSAKIHEDGSFSATKVPVGTNLIRLANVPLGSSAADKLFGSYHSPIRCVVREHTTEPLVVDVLDELVRYNLRTRVRELRLPGTGNER